MAVRLQQTMAILSDSERLLTILGTFVSYLFVWLVMFAHCMAPMELPRVSFSTDHIRQFIEGEDALLTCVVTNTGGRTVMWSKVFNGSKVELSIDKLRVTPDDRFSILHDEAPTFNHSLILPGGEVWVLSIKKVRKADEGFYTCKINSDPPVQVSFTVQVIPRGQVVLPRAETTLSSMHNYTSCCQKKRVAPKCLGFCNIHDILEGSTGIEPEECEPHFPNIVQCMADYRDHVPCCKREGIPDICQDLCRGEYTVQDDYIKSHFSCSQFTKATLLCISEGITTLPQPPNGFFARSVSPTSIHVEWDPPLNDTGPTGDYYIINSTTIKRFDPPVDATDAGAAVPDYDYETESNTSATIHQIQYKVSAENNTFLMKNLTPLTWYELSIKAVNRFGSSLVPYSVRVLTPAVEEEEGPVVVPDLPNIMDCCISKGIAHSRCLNTLCNPSNPQLNEADLIICAPWVKESMSCLTDGNDHSDCCRERGLPPLCVELCTGNISKIDYTYFRCLDYHSEFRSCIMKGYGVLPSEPLLVTVSNMGPTYALLSWQPPLQNADSVTSYNAYFRPLKGRNTCTREWFSDGKKFSYHAVHALKPPFVLEHLCQDTEFEVYLQAFNEHGASDPSARIIFHTQPEPSDVPKAAPYNATECCRAVSLSPACMPLCDYNARMSHMKTLAGLCRAEMGSLLKCTVGGRNHSPCCKRRGVPESCQGLCTGVFRGAEGTPSACMAYIGNIMLCLEEGIGLIPGPVRSLYLTDVSSGNVTLHWETDPDSANMSGITYGIHYQQVDSYSEGQDDFLLNNVLNVSSLSVVITGLKMNSIYKFFVTAHNGYGESLPSSVITKNITDSGVKVPIGGVPSAPRQPVIEEKKATSLVLVWQPPLVSHPLDRFRYHVHYKQLNGSGDFNISETSATALRLQGLMPNTQYVVFITATNDMGESRPSETILAWTDPAYPAFVETPTVHPALVKEGGDMTIICIAMGSPLPNVSLYISGTLVHQDTTRHMVTIIKNVTKDMTEVSCYADNGYGMPMQASITVTIHHRPVVKLQSEVQVAAGEEVTLECEVSAHPEPSLVWWHDAVARKPVIHGGNYSIQTLNPKQSKYITKLTIAHARSATFYCHASNIMGSSTHSVMVKTWDMIPVTRTLAQCCRDRNVSSDCLSSCDEFRGIDLARVWDTSRCITDLGKFVLCASDGSDHRHCCARFGIPVQCLNWCRGIPVVGQRVCLVEYTSTFLKCFHEGSDTLPGPPTGVSVKPLSETSVEISWEPPSKNPETVEIYRVFWRKTGDDMVQSNDTSRRTMLLSGLEPGATYEIAVKAGNHMGTSILARAREYKHMVAYITSRTSQGSSNVGMVVGMCLFFMFLVLMVGGFLLWGYRRYFLKMKGAPGSISFENPSYIREQNGDTIQIAETPTGRMNGTAGGGATFSSGEPNGNASSNGSGASTPTDRSWNPTTPGFEDDLPKKGGYYRFKS